MVRKEIMPEDRKTGKETWTVTMKKKDEASVMDVVDAFKGAGFGVAPAALAAAQAESEKGSGSGSSSTSGLGSAEASRLSSSTSGLGSDFTSALASDSTSTQVVQMLESIRKHSTGQGESYKSGISTEGLEFFSGIEQHSEWEAVFPFGSKQFET